MKKNSVPEWPEIIFSSSDLKESKAISRAIKKGKLRKIAVRIYTSNFDDPVETIIKRHRYYILSQLYPNAVISHRSALEGGISSTGSVILSYKYTRTVVLPGLIIRLIKGPGPDIDDMPFLENIYIASQARAFLENMQKSRTREMDPKTLPISEIGSRLDRFIRICNRDEINALRDQAKRIALRLNMQEEYQSLDKMIGALLGTKKEIHLQTESASFRSQGVPFDPERIELFAGLTAHLFHADLPDIYSLLKTKSANINQAFFESYFSNYIEGTQFAIEEAEKIIFENKIFPNRKEDSHDILSTYRIISNDLQMRTVPDTSEHFEFLLQDRHATLMGARKDTLPGKFKNIINRAGNTVFVKPDEVRGTLIKGFDFYKRLKPGLARAIYVMFLISEVHPFIDGNGRIARIFMNAELHAKDQSHIIIPTVFREDYILALRKLSRKQEADSYTRMLLTAQVFTNSISFDDYNQALIQLKLRNAFLEPSEGKLIL